MNSIYSYMRPASSVVSAPSDQQSSSASLALISDALGQFNEETIQTLGKQAQATSQMQAQSALHSNQAAQKAVEDLKDYLTKLANTHPSLGARIGSFLGFLLGGLAACFTGPVGIVLGVAMMTWAFLDKMPTNSNGDSALDIADQNGCKWARAVVGWTLAVVAAVVAGVVATVVSGMNPLAGVGVALAVGIAVLGATGTVGNTAKLCGAGDNVVTGLNIGFGVAGAIAGLAASFSAAGSWEENISQGFAKALPWLKAGAALGGVGSGFADVVSNYHLQQGYAQCADVARQMATDRQALNAYQNSLKTLGAVGQQQADQLRDAEQLYSSQLMSVQQGYYNIGEAVRNGFAA